MKQHLKFAVSLSLMIVLPLATACEITRQGDDLGDISTALPGPAGGGSPTAVVEATPTAVSEAPPTPETAVPPPDISEISTERFSAPIAPPANTAFEPDQVLVKLTQQAAVEARTVELGPDGIVAAGITSLDGVLREIGAVSLEPVIRKVVDVTGNTIESFSVQAPEISQIYVVNFAPDRSPQEVINLMTQDPTVEYAEPNYIAGITARPVYLPAPLTPNDPYFQYQWHLAAIQAPEAWDIATGQNVVVAVIDTGIDFGAPDLANASRLPGHDFVNNDGDPTDDQSHGTHVAGTIAQNTNNGIGVAGVAFNATLLPVKVLGSNGQGSYDGIIQGIVYAVDQGAKVINMSLAGRNGSQALEEAVRYAYSRGVTVVAAAGNSGGVVEFPAAYDNYVIAVGAVRFDKTLAPYSNFGPQIDVVAPGGDTNLDQNLDGYADGVLQQTFKSPGSGYTYLFFEGTSMASPHVAGLAALMLSRKPDASPDEIKGAMMQTAWGNLGPADQFGAGLIQAANALAAISGPVQQPTNTPTPTIPTPTSTSLPPDTATPTNTPFIPTDTPTPTSIPTTEPVPVTDTPTPTLTPVIVEPPTATPVPLPPGELLVNGGFESNEGWVFGDTPIPGGYDTTIVLSGNRSARLGDTTGRDVFSFSSVWQRVTIPTEARQVILRANIYPISQDVPGTDIQYIAILNDRFRLIRTLSSELNNSQTWEPRTYDISDLRGQTIYIYFSVLNRGRTGRLSAMYVDDVSLSWGQ
jgi:subtilisin family serine protease